MRQRVPTLTGASLTDLSGTRAAAYQTWVFSSMRALVFQPERQQRMGGLLESHVLKERMNRRQADIAGASAVLSTVLEMIEKITNEGHVQVLDREIRGRFTEPVFCKMGIKPGISRYLFPPKA